MHQEIQIEETLRLRRYDGECAFALEWYQDVETLRLVDGGYAKPYDFKRLKGMYEYLNQQGELYFIEVKEANDWIPIGDVTFWKDDMPIVIGNQAYRGRGIGKKVVEALKCRAEELEYKEIYVACIYHYNKGSQKLFQSVGFKVHKETEEGKSYKLILCK